MDPCVDWQALTTDDFRQLDPERTVAVLPVAATEQHGPHLPLGTDAMINRGIIDAARGRIAGCQVIVLPALDVGSSDEHRDFPGTLSIGAEHLLPAWLEIGRSVARAGVRKLVILNSHGGQRAIVDLAALRLRIDCDLLVARCNYFSFGAPDGLFDASEWRHGIHGGEAETSLMLCLHPELVRRDRLDDFDSLGQHLAGSATWLGVEKPIGIGWKAQDLNAAGVVGRASRADADRGAAWLAHLAAAFATLLREIADTPHGIIADR